MKSLVEAQRAVLVAMAPLPEIEADLGAAAGLVLSAPVRAPHDVPPFANASMDGFALRAADTAAAPATLAVLEDVPAGRLPTREVVAGTAIRIMTGAPLPVGADAVVRVEDTAATDGGAVLVQVAVEVGNAVRLPGGDVAAGTEVFAAGERLGAHHLGVLASLGVVRPRVRRRPRVAVLSTGDEVVPPVATPGPGEIRDANRFTLTALLGDLGAEVIDLGIVGDDTALLRDALAEGAAVADAVLTSGGVSMGDYDLVKQVLAGYGTVEFWKVAMQPGKPFAFGLLGTTPLFGLPGNPVSVAVSFEQFVRPALLHRMGARRLFRPRVRGFLAETVRTEEARTVFLRVHTEYRDGAWAVSLSGGQDSNMLSALARADAFAVVPAGVSEMPGGAAIDLEMFRWPETRTMEEALE